MNTLKEKVEAALAAEKAALARLEAKPMPRLKFERARLGAAEHAAKHTIALLEELLK